MRKIFSFPVALSSLLVVMAVLAVQSRFVDPDMWWHLKIGQIIWTTHSIPLTDLFSYTTNHHYWIPAEWLSETVMYGAYSLAGYYGLMLWFCSITSAILIAGFGLCTLYSGNLKVGFLGAMAIGLFATTGLSVRPQLVGYFLLIVELLLIHLGRTRNPYWFIGLPILFALWINCHGSFFLGLIVAGIILFSSFFNFQKGALASQQWTPFSRRMLLGAFVLSGAALFLNPDGIKTILYPLITVFGEPNILANVEEWQQMPWHSGRGAGLIFVLLCCLLLPIIRRSVLYLDELLLLMLGGWIAVNHQRMVFAFGILAAPILARMLSDCWEGYNADRDRPLLNGILVTLSLLTAFWAVPSQAELTQQVEHQSPVKAVEFMKSHHLSGHMLNDFNNGGYLLWAAPEYPVFVDSRGDVYEWTGILAEFGNWATLQNDPNIMLDKYKIDFCLLDRQSTIARMMSLLHGWKTIYSDNNSVILWRTASGNRSSQ